MPDPALLPFFPPNADIESLHKTTLLKLPSSTHHSAHNKATNSVENIDMPSGSLLLCQIFTLGTYKPNPTRQLSGSLEPSV